MRFEPQTIHDLIAADFDAVIDVRSPSEFADDHLPGAINLPVLSDEERARVGTVYVQKSAFLARKMGAAIVARNAADHIDSALAQHDGSWRPLVYCWRGGQRSGSFAAILSQIGWRVQVLEGGYRTWRRLVNDQFYEARLPHRLVLLDGNTGTAKTDLLTRLATRGAQVLDLEMLANHRGSALGALGEQPSQKGFESRIAVALHAFDPAVPVVVEAESSKIGRINLPPRLFDAMREAPRIEITASVADRAAFLVESYSDIVKSPAVVSERLEKLVRLQGRETVAHWKLLAHSGGFLELATELIEKHYDPRYSKVRERVGREIVAEIEADSLDLSGRETLADRLFEVIKQL